LAVDGSGLAIGVGFVVVGIEDLNFVIAHQEDTAVTAFLAFAVGRRGLGEFDVELAITEGSFGVDVAGVRNYFHVAIFHFPLSGAVVGA